LKRVSLVTFIQSLEKRGCDRLEVSVSPDRIFFFFLSSYKNSYFLPEKKKKYFYSFLDFLFFIFRLPVTSDIYSRKKEIPKKCAKKLNCDFSC
jgi:hypothetical protein